MAVSMQFWGIEVKPNQTVKCEAAEDKLLHLSMAALGESKKSTDNVVIYATFDNQKLVIGTLSSEKCAQISYDLVFEKDFELSHSSKNASVYFTGYKTVEDEVPSDFDDSEFEEEEAVVHDALKAKSNAEKEERKAKVEALKANKAEQIPDDDDDSEDVDFEDDDVSHDGSSDDEDMVEAENGSDDEDDEDDEDDDSEKEEETPKEAASKGKKRPAEPVTKTAVSEKKAKLATPADGKKGGDAKSGKNQHSPKSGGSVSCKSCSKTFNSEKGLESHTKAKHAAK